MGSIISFAYCIPATVAEIHFVAEIYDMPFGLELSFEWGS